MSFRICFVGPMLGRHIGWVPNPCETLGPRLEGLGHTCYLTSRYLNRSLRLTDMLVTILQLRHKIDLLCIQVYGGLSFIGEDLSSLLGQTLGIPCVMVLRGGAMPQFMQKNPRWTKRVLSRARCIVTPSAYLAKAIEPYGFQARVIPNAIDLQNYPFQLRRQLQPRLLWMRTFHEIYNPQMAVDVLKRLKETYPHATLTMAGQEKGLLEPTRAYTRELGLEDHVSFTGFLNMGDKQRVFPAHDIYLNTNRVDNMPVSVVEAAAFGTPIVATAVGGVPFLLTDGENAFLVPDEDVSAMTQSICRLLASPELAAHFSRAGRTLAEASDWSQVLHQWEKTFTEVLRRR